MAGPGQIDLLAAVASIATDAFPETELDRTRAQIREWAERLRAAADDIAAVLKCQPGRPDASALRERLAWLERQTPRLN